MVHVTHIYINEDVIQVDEDLNPLLPEMTMQ